TDRSPTRPAGGFGNTPMLDLDIPARYLARPDHAYPADVRQEVGALQRHGQQASVAQVQPELPRPARDAALNEAPGLVHAGQHRLGVLLRCRFMKLEA